MKERDREKNKVKHYMIQLTSPLGQVEIDVGCFWNILEVFRFNLYGMIWDGPDIMRK